MYQYTQYYAYNLLLEKQKTSLFHYVLCIFTFIITIYTDYKCDFKPHLSEVYFIYIYYSLIYFTCQVFLGENNMSFYTRYAECCKQKKIAPVSQEAANKLGCSKSNISFLARTGNMPKGEIVAGAAKMLNVSADYLLGLTNLPSSLQSDDNITATVQEALLLFRELNPDGQAAALAMLRGLTLQDMYKS